MSSLYPTLEDMKVDQIQKAQVREAEKAYQQQYQNPAGAISWAPPGAAAPPPASSNIYAVYPSLMEEYMGLRLEPPTGAIVPVQQTGGQVAVPSAASANALMVAPLTAGDVGLRRAQVTNGIREVICCKDGQGKVGLRLKAVNKGVFVQFVMRNSPAALAGLRVGDQILQLNGENLAGIDDDKATKLLKKADGARITMAVRDRPFERTMTLHKDSSGHVGFQHKKGKIIAIVKDSSAARNGLLIDHQILEINGQNVLGLKEKEIAAILDGVPQIVTLTVMPSFIYDHMMKHMADALVKDKMDHSIPDMF